MQSKRVDIALSCLSDEDVARAARQINDCQELSQSLTVLRIKARQQGSPAHEAWPKIWGIFARCTSLAHLDLAVFEKADLLMLLAAFRRYTFPQLRFMHVGTYGYISARECLQFLSLAPNLQVCDHLPGTTGRLDAVDVEGTTEFHISQLWASNAGVLLPLLLAGRCTARDVMLDVNPHLMQHLAAVDWVSFAGLSVSSLTINSSRIDNGYYPGPLVSFALACRSLRRLQLYGRAQVILELLKLLLTDHHCRLNALELTYGSWGNVHPLMLTWTPPPTMPTFVSMLRSAVALRVLKIRFPPRAIDMLVPDSDELSHFCRSRRIVLTVFDGGHAHHQMN